MGCGLYNLKHYNLRPIQRKLVPVHGVYQIVSDYVIRIVR